jgi:hypothetical protein
MVLGLKPSWRATWYCVKPVCSISVDSLVVALVALVVGSDMGTTSSGGSSLLQLSRQKKADRKLTVGERTLRCAA